MWKAVGEQGLAITKKIWDWLPNENVVEVVKALCIGVVLSAIDFAGLNSALVRESAAFNNALRVYFHSQDLVFSQAMPEALPETVRPDPVQAIIIDERGIKKLRSQFDWKGTVTDFKGYGSILNLLFAPDPAAPDKEMRPSSVFFDISVIGDDDPVFARSARRRNAPDPLDNVACDGFDIRVATPDNHRDAACFVKQVRAITHYVEWKDLSNCGDPISRINCIVAAGGRPLFFATSLADSDPTLFVQRLHEAAVPVVVSTPDGGGNVYPMVYEHVHCDAGDPKCAATAAQAFRPGNVAGVVSNRQSRFYHLSPAMAMWITDRALAGDLPYGRAPEALGRLGRDVGIDVVEDDAGPSPPEGTSRALALYTLRVMWSRCRPPLAFDMANAEAATLGKAPAAAPKAADTCRLDPDNLRMGTFLYRNLLRGLVDKDRSIVRDVIDHGNVASINVRNLFDAAAPGTSPLSMSPSLRDGELFVQASSRRHIVVGGALASGGDWFPTPISVRTPGVYIHANAYLTLKAMELNGAAPYRDLSGVWEFLAPAWIYVLGLVMAYLTDHAAKAVTLRLRLRLGRSLAFLAAKVGVYVFNWLFIIAGVMVLSLAFAICGNVNGINTLEIMVVFATLPVVFKMIKPKEAED